MSELFLSSINHHSPRPCLMFLRWRGSPQWGWETTYYSAAGGEKRLKTRMAMKGFCGTRWRRALRHHSRGFTWDLPTERSDSRLSSVRGEIAFCALLFLTLDVVVAQCHLFQHSCLLATQRCLPAGADGWKPITHLVKTGSMIGSNLLSEGGEGRAPTCSSRESTEESDLPGPDQN